MNLTGDHKSEIFFFPHQDIISPVIYHVITDLEVLLLAQVAAMVGSGSCGLGFTALLLMSKVLLLLLLLLLLLDLLLQMLLVPGVRALLLLL